LSIFRYLKFFNTDCDIILLHSEKFNIPFYKELLQFKNLKIYYFLTQKNKNENNNENNIENNENNNEKNNEKNIENNNEKNNENNIEKNIENKNENIFNDRINIEYIKKLIDDINEREIYISGPDKLMTYLKIHLLNLKIDKEKIFFDFFI
jgi:ferredoxin-NADP reductase